MFDSSKRLVLKVPLSKNKTFEINIKATEFKFLKLVESLEDCWLWHLRFEPLNFRSLHELGAKHMKVGQPVIVALEKLCEVCMVGKQEIPSRLNSR